MESSLVWSTRAIKGVPIFPARIVYKPAFFKMWSIGEVVVVLPFEPVIPIKSPRRKRSASSTSLQMVTPLARAACSKGASAGTPGLGTIRSCSRKEFSRWPPSSRLTPAARSGAIVSPISFSLRASVPVTFAPRSAQKSAVATPVLASPTTNKRLPRNSNGFGITLANENTLLPQFQGRQREQRKHQRRNPEPHDHFRFAPAKQLEMMVDGRHAEDALAAQLERAHLQNHRQGFQHKNSPNEEQQNLLLDDDGDHAEGPAQRERAHIAHKDFRGMRVVPQKAERRAYERAAKHRKLAHFRDVLNVEVRRPAEIAADISQHGQGARGDHRTADGEAVQPISQVDGIGRAHDDNADENEKRNKRQWPEMWRMHEGVKNEI